MDLMSLIIIVACAGLMAVLESLRFTRTNLSQDELERRATKGDKQAAHELKVRGLLPYFLGLLRIKVGVLVVVLVGVAVAQWQWLGGLAAFGVLALVAVVVSRGWLLGLGAAFGRMVEPHLWRFVEKAAPVLTWVSPHMAGAEGASFASKDELLAMITRDTNVLSPEQKQQLLAAAEFPSKTVADAMVPRAKIVTVRAKEAMGPLLLDRLHKAGHAIFPVVKKDLDHLEGLLYMSDLAPLHPDIKTVADATRAKVIRLKSNAPLSEVLVASLQTTRHFFIVEDSGQVVGLITLGDALAVLLGKKL